MPENYTNIYQSARRTARLTQEAAAELLDISVESVKAYETDLRMPPNVMVVRMVQVYDAPWLALEHLQAAAAPLGILPEVRVQSLPTAVISLINRAADFKDHHRQLLRIAEDGVIDEGERPLFEDIAGELEGLISAAYSVIYPMEAHTQRAQEKKTAPTCEGTLKRSVQMEAVDQGHAVCAYSGELSKEQFRDWAYLQAAGPEHVVYKADTLTGKQIAVADGLADKQISEWLFEKFLLFDLERNTHHDPETILSQFEYAKMRYGADVFLVDNIMSVDFEGQREQDFYRMQSKFTQMLVTFSKRHRVHTHLVVHPRKSSVDNGRKITADDVSGSGDITNRADNVFFLTMHTVSDTGSDGGKPVQKPLLKILKNRDFGARGEIWLDFDRKSRRYFSDRIGDPKRPYGWDPSAHQMQIREVQAGNEPLPF